MSTGLGAKKRASKRNQIRKIFDLLDRFEQVILVQLENVGSNQVQQTRKALDKKKATLLIGKNTVTKKAIKLLAEGCKKDDVDTEEEFAYYSRFTPKPQLNALAAQMSNKVGLIFTETPVFELKGVIESNRVAAVARPGIVAPIDVTIPGGPTGLDPSQIGFFHALSISTKINKGQIEILTDVKVCTKGMPVMPSQATLLEKLNIKPFTYGMELHSIYDDGTILTPAQACISGDHVISLFQQGAKNLTGLSLALGVANELSVPHLVSNAFKNLLAISVNSDYKLAQLENLQKAQSPKKQKSPEKKKESPKKKDEPKKKEEPKAEEEEDIGFGGLF